MIHISPDARYEYEMAYRSLRIHGGGAFGTIPWYNADEIEDCAILSCDYHDSGFSGWINRQRFLKYRQLKAYAAMRDYGLLS